MPTNPDFSQARTGMSPGAAGTSARATGLLDIESLDRIEIEAILARAHFFQPAAGETFRRLDALRGKMIVNLFFEASTRTRVSFEIAAKRLGADTVSIAAQGSSVSKGESLVDTLNTLVAMRPNAIVMRHESSGAPHFLARHLQIRSSTRAMARTNILRRALLDARTILDQRPTLEGLRVAIIGDIAHSRVARSNVHLPGEIAADIVLCGPPSLLPREFEQLAPGVRLAYEMTEAIRDADVIMMLRVQLERQHEAPMSAGEYSAFMDCGWSISSWRNRM